MSILQALSQELTAAVEAGGKGIVRVDDGTRFTATGTVWSENLIVATSHGVENDENLTIETHDNQTFPATLLGRDDEADIALLQINTNLQPITRAREGEITAGAFVLALGRPGRSGLQATHGIVGSVRRYSESNQGLLVHTDATLYPGFSGGALVSTEGKFVGLINLNFGRRGGGIVLSPALIEEAVKGIQTGDKGQRGYLGIASQPVEIQGNLKSSNKDLPDLGLLVMSVEPGSGAEKGGVYVGDVIIRLNGHPLRDPHDLRHVLKRFRAGTQTQVEVLRGGSVQQLEVTLGARE